MITFVEDLSHTAKTMRPGFFIVAQNAEALLTKNGKPDGPVNSRYLQSIDAISKEGLFYGYKTDNVATPGKMRTYSISFLDVAKEQSKTIMAVDYCSSTSKIKDSYRLNRKKGYISFAAPERELDKIPLHASSVIRANDRDIESLSEARNFLYVLNPHDYNTKRDFLEMLHKTNYDIIILDWVFEKGLPISNKEIEALKTKANGGDRLVIAYMSIGEAEDYRYYWQEEWNHNRPFWIKKENPDWPGNYAVQYWTTEWKDLVYRSENSYLVKLIRAGYDGIYLDRIDTFYYFEQQTRE